MITHIFYIFLSLIWGWYEANATSIQYKLWEKCLQNLLQHHFSFKLAYVWSVSYEKKWHWQTSFLSFLKWNYPRGLLLLKIKHNSPPILWFFSCCCWERLSNLCLEVFLSIKWQIFLPISPYSRFSKKKKKSSFYKQSIEFCSSTLIWEFTLLFLKTKGIYAPSILIRITLSTMTNCFSQGFHSNLCTKLSENAETKQK